MYFPYLRARQFELIALRDLASENLIQGVVSPILEPVKGSYNNLNIANRVFVEHEQTAYLIVNPIVGEVVGNRDTHLEYLSRLDESNFIPAFHYLSNADYVSGCIERFDLKKCMLICPNDTSADDAGLQSLIERPEITLYNVETPDRNRSLSRLLKRHDKSVIRLDDTFEKQARNSDYLDMEEHRLSEEHLYFREDGYQGFSDYTVLPSEFTDGGSTPRAVVIHLSYLGHQNQIWIRHFTSDTNDSIANVQGKFAEAARKAVTYCQEQGLMNSAIQELIGYFEDQHYPGLGTVKKIAIKNHLLVVANSLRQ